jgi:hypothetical protein
MSAPKANNKQLLDEAEHDINNYSDVLSLRSMWTVFWKIWPNTMEQFTRQLET